MSEYLIVLNDGETYSSTDGAVIYKIVSDEFYEINHDKEIREGIEQGYLVHATDLESIVNTPDLLDC
jgi:hypothetical protein